MIVDLSLTEPQEDFVFSPAEFPLIVAGFGAGKSEALIKRSILQKLQYPDLDQGYFAPTFDLIRLIAWDRYQNILNEMGVPFKTNKSDRTITVMGKGKIIFRSMENPDGIVGFETADNVIDELDTLKTIHAENAWNKIIARGRQRKPDGKPNTSAVGTTPEGFRFCYDRWVRNGGGNYQLYRASTSSNPFLPDGYVQALRDTYPPQLLDAYLEGLFVNLAAGGVYPEFNRALNRSDATIQTREPLHVGMDFNVLKMAAVVFVVRDGLPIAVDELTGVRDTPQMIELIKERYSDHHITVYPDAAGQATSSKSASVSDHNLLRAAGFVLSVNGTNPNIKDRVNGFNAMILNADGARRLKVNPDKCPTLVEALEQQAYDKNGMPDKQGGFDHITDAAGYFLAKRYPLARPPLKVSKSLLSRV
jgi:hypothetical protein